MNRFPMHRRINVLHVDDEEAIAEGIALGDPFIIRPKKGKPLLRGMAP